MSGLVLERIEVRRGAEVIVRLDARVAPGEVLTIMGPSGSGKSTALAAIIGTLSPDFTLTGRLVLDGRDVTGLPTQARGIGLLFQDDVLFPHLSVGGNLAFGLPASVRGRAVRRAAVEAALVSADLAGFADRDPATLSGGQRARVALMRTLLARPRRAAAGRALRPAGHRAARAHPGLRASGRIRAEGLPAILVTHDPEDARAAGGPVVDPMGRVVAV